MKLVKLRRELQGDNLFEKYRDQCMNSNEKMQDEIKEIIKTNNKTGIEVFEHEGIAWIDGRTKDNLANNERWLIEFKPSRENKEHINPEHYTLDEERDLEKIPKKVLEFFNSLN